MWRGFQHDFISVSFLYAVNVKSGAFRPSPRKRLRKYLSAFLNYEIFRKKAQIIYAAPTAGARGEQVEV